MFSKSFSRSPSLPSSFERFLSSQLAREDPASDSTFSLLQLCLVETLLRPGFASSKTDVSSTSKKTGRRDEVSSTSSLPFSTIASTLLP